MQINKENAVQFINQIKEQFPSPAGTCSIAYHVPMEYLELLQEAMRVAGIKNRVRFRGPRFANRHTLKEDAVSFSVYNK